MKPNEPFLVVFLCTGNICRSPMAQGVLARELDEGTALRARVESAGVAAAPGLPASAHAVTACAEIGIDISGHRSQPFTAALAERADLVLAMEMHHLMAARSLAPQAATRMHLLSQYAAGSDDAPPLGVSDPIGGDLDEYREALGVIRAYVEQALPRIRAEIAGASARS